MVRENRPHFKSSNVHPSQSYRSITLMSKYALGWEWSSFRHYVSGAEGRVEIESQWTAREREQHKEIVLQLEKQAKRGHSS